MNEFTGIWLPESILSLKDLNLTERVLLAQVVLLSLSGECRALNRTLAGNMRVTETTVSLSVKSLRIKEYLVVEDNNATGNQRLIYPSLKTLMTLFKNLKEGDGYSLKILKSLFKNLKEGVSKSERGYLKILKSLFKNLKELYIWLEIKLEIKGEIKPEINKPQEPIRDESRGGETGENELTDPEPEKPSSPGSAAPPSPKPGKPPKKPPQPINIPFDVWWDAYEKKIDRKPCERKWNRLTDEQRQAALAHTGPYVLSTPDVSKRKNPETYLNKESWTSEIIEYHEPARQATNGTHRTNRRSNGSSQPENFGTELDQLIEGYYGT
ncbi:hypothetical protein GCM10027347_52860 [Larkinella harenae]